MPVALIFREDHIRLKDFPLPHAFSLYSAGNMDQRFERDISLIQERRDKILESIGGYPLDKCVSMNAKHGSEILKVKKDRLGDSLDCDCMVTFIRGSVLALAPADCLPILLTNYSKSFAALIHAGWQGLDKDIVGKCVRFLENRKKVHPFEITAAIGPGIKSCCYNNRRLYERLCGEDKWKPFISKADGGRIDILAKTKSDLTSAGVPDGNIQAADICTCCSKKDGLGSGPLTFSHWRKKNEGRFLAVVALPD